MLQSLKFQQNFFLCELESRIKLFIQNVFAFSVEIGDGGLSNQFFSRSNRTSMLVTTSSHEHFPLDMTQVLASCHFKRKTSFYTITVKYSARNNVKSDQFHRDFPCNFVKFVMSIHIYTLIIPGIVCRTRWWMWWNPFNEPNGRTLTNSCRYSQVRTKYSRRRAAAELHRWLIQKSCMSSESWTDQPTWATNIWTYA